MRLQSISDQIQTLETPEDLDGVAEHVKNLEMFLAKTSSKPCLPIVSDEVKKIPANKTVVQQRKFKQKNTNRK